MLQFDKNHFEQHLNEKWVNKVCPICYSNNWIYDEAILTPLGVGNHAEILIGGKIVPLIAVTCINCGNTVFINAKVANSLSEAQDDKQGE